MPVRWILLACMAASAAGAAQAQAYVRGGVTLSQSEDLGESTGFEIAGGLSLGAWRGEISADRSTFTLDAYANGPISVTGGDIDVTTVFLSAYHDFNAGGSWRPYVGAGVGTSKLDAPGVFWGAPAGGGIWRASDDTELAWHGSTGVNVSLTENLYLDVGYRYADYPQAEYSGSVSYTTGGQTYTVNAADLPTSAASHQIRASLRFQF